MIEVNMTRQEGVILDTNGKYCEENIKVTPAFDFAQNAKRWDINLKENLTSPSILLTDSWLEEHKNDENLTVCLIFKSTIDATSNPGYFCFSITRNLAMLAGGTEIGTVYGFSTRGRSSAYSHNYARKQVGDSGTGGYYGGQLTIKSNGELHMQCSEGYQLQAGDYNVIAWLE